MNNFPTLPHPWEEVSLLVVSGDENDHSRVRQILNHPNWTVRRCSSCSDAIYRLAVSHAQVILCERDLPDGDWRALLNATESVDRAPLLVVTSTHADEHLWAEVLNLGGYDVLQKPYDRNELLRVLGLAWRNWKSRWEPDARPAQSVRTAGTWVA